MSYYTYHELEIIGEEGAYDLEFHKENISKDADYDSVFEDSVTWRYMDQNMLDYSIKYPLITFCIHRNGEESDDFEKCYYKNGKNKNCNGKIVYEEYNEKDLK